MSRVTPPKRLAPHSTRLRLFTSARPDSLLARLGLSIVRREPGELDLVVRNIGPCSHAARPPKTIVANREADSRGHQRINDPPNWRREPMQYKYAPVQDPGTWRRIHYESGRV